MASKLTLSLDSKIIEAAKKYSEKKGISISKLVEEYLRKITHGKKKKSSKTSLMSIRGALGKKPSGVQYKDDRDQYLIEKYK